MTSSAVDGVSPTRLLTRDFALLWTGALAFMGSFQLLLTVLPLYARELGASEPEIGLIIGLFAGSAMLVRLPVGWQLDRGRRVPLLMAGAAIFALSSAGYALVGSIAAILAIRVFHGTGMSIFSTAGQTVAVDVAPPGRRGEALGVYGIAQNLASGLGPPLGLALAAALGFTALFGISAALAGLAVALSALIVDPPRQQVPRRSGTVFNLAVVRPGFVMWAVMFTYGGIAAFIPILALQRGLANPGLFFTVYAGAMVVAQTLAGRASDRLGRKAAIVPGLVLLAVGLAGVGLLGDWWLLGAALVYGLGAGACQPSLFATAGDLVASEARGSAMATMGLFLELGISSGAIVVGLLAGVLGLGTTFVLGAAVPLIGLASLMLPGSLPRAHGASVR